MVEINVQRAVSNIYIPKTTQLKKWAKSVLQKKREDGELTIRIVDNNEITLLNSTYRHKNKPTNILSFPFEQPPGVQLDTPILGDLVICASVIAEEAQQQKKEIDAHWAHMIVHGILHLLGFDHEKNDDAERMEAEEIKCLKLLGFNNPYKGDHDE